MRSILPFDELNKFTASLRERFPSGKLVKADGNIAKEEEEDIIDEMLDLFLLAYATGNEVTNASLSSDWTPTLDDVMDTVGKKVAGKTWRERAEDYFANGGSVDDLVRIAETETHRDANEAALSTAKHGGATSKTWVTMLDDKVRDTHIPLEGVTVPIDAEFYTWDGDHAPHPGAFEQAYNNVNCRCECLFTKE